MIAVNTHFNCYLVVIGIDVVVVVLSFFKLIDVLAVFESLSA